jgi:hypothetical protein
LAVRYKTGGGSLGNVGPTTLEVLEGSFLDSHGRPIRLRVTNRARATGGVDRQSVASAKLLAPTALRALTRSVSREDFEVHARKVPGVARALMLTSNEDPTIAENAGILFVIPNDGTLPSAALSDAVLRQVTDGYPCTLTFQVSVQAAAYRS